MAGSAFDTDLPLKVSNSQLGPKSSSSFGNAAIPQACLSPADGEDTSEDEESVDCGDAGSQGQGDGRLSWASTDTSDSYMPYLPAPYHAPGMDADAMAACMNQQMHQQCLYFANWYSHMAGQMGQGQVGLQQWSQGSGSANQADLQVEEEDDDSTNTTVMLKNIPPHYNRAKLIELLDDEGFNARYDFAYLPFDFKKKTRLGYALVNMINHDEAVSFIEHFEGLENGRGDSTDPKVPNVYEAKWGKLHCKNAHVERYRNSPLMHPDVPEDYKPMVFDEHGQMVDFPGPTQKKAVQLPRGVKCESSRRNSS